MAEDTHYRKNLGNWGENLALEYLTDKGYELLERNFHSRRVFTSTATGTLPNLMIRSSSP